MVIIQGEMSEPHTEEIERKVMFRLECGPLNEALCRLRLLLNNITVCLFAVSFVSCDTVLKQGQVV